MSGVETQNQLIYNYGNTLDSCGMNKPAYACSGVLLRARETFTTRYHTWDPSPTQKNKKGVSFSYIRSDINFKRFAYNYNTGYIFFPTDLTPHSQKKINFKCIYPIDGATDSRRPTACDAYGANKYTAPCQTINIATGNDWYSKYKGLQENQICGFDINPTAIGGAIAGFNAGMDAIRLIKSPVQNEIISDLWSSGDGANLPLMAFFYISGTQGIQSAKLNQADYANTTNIWVPVIEVVMPDQESDFFRFYFNAEDQQISQP